MARNKREIGEINAGSMADIAFLLLIFFLVTTTMDMDTGIMRQLPPPPPPNFDPPEVKERNVYIVLANASNALLVEGEYMDIENLKEGAKEFLTNPSDLETLPERRRVTAAFCNEKIAELQAALPAFANDIQKKSETQEKIKKWNSRLEAVQVLGDYWELPKAVISLQNDRGTSYGLYIQVQNELQAAVRELRDEISMEKFGVPFGELSEKNEEEKRQILAIRQVMPQRISEAEPFDATGL